MCFTQPLSVVLLAFLKPLLYHNTRYRRDHVREHRESNESCRPGRSHMQLL